jgi:putative transposase
MQKVAGEFAQSYNSRKNRSGAFWGERYHGTIVENGRHLWACLIYIDLNMVRAGVGAHPSDWKWTAWHELMGLRKRYRVIDFDQLLTLVDIRDMQQFRIEYKASIQVRIDQRSSKRNPKWTESFAVGSRPFITKITATVGGQIDSEYEKSKDDENSWILGRKSSVKLDF